MTSLGGRHAAALGVERRMAMISVADAARKWKISTSHLRWLVANGVVRGLKLKHAWTIDSRSLRIYLETPRRRSRRVKVS